MNVSRVACGSLFNFVVSKDCQSLYSWGVNDEGELVSFSYYYNVGT